MTCVVADRRRFGSPSSGPGIGSDRTRRSWRNDISPSRTTFGTALRDSLGFRATCLIGTALPG